MHDCNGRPIIPFCRVRAATKEELEAKGRPLHNQIALSPAEQFAFPGSYQSDTCNVSVTPEPSFSPGQSGLGPVEMRMVLPAWPQLCSGYALVRVD